MRVVITLNIRYHGKETHLGSLIEDVIAKLEDSVTSVNVVKVEVSPKEG